MQAYLQFINRFKLLIVTVVPLIVLLMSLSLKEIAFEGGYRIWFAEDSPILREYDAFRKVFGSDDFIVIAFRDEAGIFTPKALASVERITAALWRTPQMTQVLSLTNLPHIHADAASDDDVSVDAFIQNPLQQREAYFSAKKAIALSDPLIAGLFIGSEGKTTLISAKIVAGARESGEKSFELRDAVQKILDEEQKVTGYSYRLSGALPMQVGFIEVMIRELLLFIPLIALCVSLLLYLIYRRISSVIVPMSVVGLAILAVASAEVMAGYRINNFTADIPVFILAIGIATTVHIYTTWHGSINSGADNVEAVITAVKKNMLPVFLTALTTAIGFGSLAVSSVVPVYTLGVATAGAVLLIFVLSLFFMPAMLLLIKNPKPMPHAKEGIGLAHYGRFVVQNRRMIIGASLAFFLFLGIGLSWLRIDGNLIRFLDKEVDVRQATEFVMEHITGPMGYEIVVDSLKGDGIKEPAFMRSVERFCRAYAAEFGDVRKVTSLADVVKALNAAMHGDNPAFMKIPDTREEIAQYLLFYSLSLPPGLQLSDSVDVSQRYLRISAQTNLVYSQHDLRMIEWAEAWWRVNTLYRAKVDGQTAMFAKMQTDITQTLLGSIGLSIVLVSAVMLMVFRNFWRLPLYILPNLLPFVMVLGAMGWLGIYVDLGVAISGAVILGIAVDDTMHFLVRYYRARGNGQNVEAALDTVMHSSGRAMLVTTLILSLSFMLLMSSAFIPNAHFGIVTASALMIALVTDLLFLPALLSMVDKEGA